MLTTDYIIKTVRELIFDRFVIPAFVLKGVTGYKVSVQGGILTIKDSGDVTKATATLSAYPTFEDLATYLISQGIVLAYGATFNGFDAVNLLDMPEKAMNLDTPVYKKYFFSTETIKEQIRYYYFSVLCITLADTTEIDTWIPKLVYPREQHLVLKVACWLVDRRRLYELALQNLTQTFSDGSAFVTAADTSATESISVQIGSVFSVTENPHSGDLYADFNKLGSDNVLGDKYSFWYKLYLYLRKKLEADFGDYSLRPDTVIVSDMELVNDLNFRAYYDSYPFTITPLLRDVITA